MARRKKKGLLSMILVLSVLALAVFGGVAIYKQYNKPVREHTTEAVKHTEKAVEHVSEGVDEGRDEVVEALEELKKILEEE